EQLAVTIALEHYTAIMAHTLLANDAVVAGADPRLSAVWRWHAIEETEHKAVAFDVYREAVGEDRGAYFRRVRVMLFVTITFWFQVFLCHFRLVRADGGVAEVGGWWRLFRFLWLRPGAMRKIVRPWLQYFRRDFHPWQHDNSELVASWRSAYEATGHAPA
ncbi:MAG: metal-dependent hydrolase, partial [Candidatus Binatia bacterium]